jgi:putative Ca2+/H+ antiporter (TMEM165/GDT1 family)
MEWKLFLTVFVTVFLAELGDKTQLATMIFAADGNTSKWVVFAGASLALIACSGIGVLAGTLVGDQINERHINLVAGIGFLIIGCYTLYNA